MGVLRPVPRATKRDCRAVGTARLQSNNGRSNLHVVAHGCLIYDDSFSIESTILPRTMNSKDTTRLHQNLIDEDGPDVTPPMLVRKLYEKDLTTKLIREFVGLEDAPSTRVAHIGLAGGYTESSRALTVLAIANGIEIIFIQLGASRRKKRGDQATTDSGLQILEHEMFCRDGCTTYAFNMGSLALSLYHDHGIKMSNGVDVQDVCDRSNRSPLAAIKFAVGDRVAVYEENVDAVFRNSVWNSQDGTKTLRHLTLQSWAARHLQSLSGMEEMFRAAPRVNTRDKPSQVSSAIARLVGYCILILLLSRRRLIILPRWCAETRRSPRKVCRPYNTT